MGFFKSFFSGKSDNPENEKQKNEQKNFEIFKYDGMRAQRMGRTDYAIKCFTEALAIQEDFETMGYLVQVCIQTNKLDEAHKLLERMTEIEPEHTSSYLSLANVCYMQEDYPAMADAAKKAIEIEEGNLPPVPAASWPCQCEYSPGNCTGSRLWLSQRPGARWTCSNRHSGISGPSRYARRSAVP